MTAMKEAPRWLVMLLLPLLLVGCEREMGDLEQFVIEARTKAQTRVEPLPEVKPHETFRYEVSGMRDPFEPIPFGRPQLKVEEEEAPKGEGPRPDFDRPREPLEAYPLDSLRMVGILEREGRRWALIKAGDGTIHRVTVGNYLGQNHGRIVDISETQVSLVELAPTGLGDWVERQASLALTE